MRWITRLGLLGCCWLACQFHSFVYGRSTPIPSQYDRADSNEFIVYSMFRNLNFGSEGEISEKNYYINIGSHQGIRVGTLLEVNRRVSTYDLSTERFYKDVTVPIAWIKVIHVEPRVAVARLDHMVPGDKGVIVDPQSIMVGDVLRPPEK